MTQAAEEQCLIAVQLVRTPRNRRWARFCKQFPTAQPVQQPARWNAPWLAIPPRARTNGGACPRAAVGRPYLHCAAAPPEREDANFTRWERLRRSALGVAVWETWPEMVIEHSPWRADGKPGNCCYTGRKRLRFSAGRLRKPASSVRTDRRRC